MPTTVTDCPAAASTKERVLDAAGRSLAVDAEYSDGSAFDCVLPCLVTLNPGTAAESFGWHGARLYARPRNECPSPLDRLPPVYADTDHRGNGSFLRTAIGFAGGSFLNE